MHVSKFMQNYYANKFWVNTFNILNYLMPPHDKSKLCAPILLKRSYSICPSTLERTMYLSPSECLSNVDSQYVSIAICAQVPWLSPVSIHLSVLVRHSTAISYPPIKTHYWLPGPSPFLPVAGDRPAATEPKSETVERAALYSANICRQLWVT